MRCNNKKCVAYTIYKETHCNMITGLLSRVCWWGYPDGDKANFPDHNKDVLLPRLAFMNKHGLKSPDPIKIKEADPRFKPKSDISIYDELLKLFSKNKGRMLTYEEIGLHCNKVTGYRYDNEQVRNMIPRMRKKFNLNIKNYPKQGYELSEI